MSKNMTEETKPKIKPKEYEKELRELQPALCRLREWVILAELRVIVMFEGRDAADKGG